jgi:hypothetical protein
MMHKCIEMCWGYLCTSWLSIHITVYTQIHGMDNVKDVLVLLCHVRLGVVHTIFLLWSFIIITVITIISEAVEHCQSHSVSRNCFTQQMTAPKLILK